MIQDDFSRDDKDSRSKAKGSERTLESNSKQGNMREEKRWRRHDDDEFRPKSRKDHDRREEKRSRRHDDYEFQP